MEKSEQSLKICFRRIFEKLQEYPGETTEITIEKDVIKNKRIIKKLDNRKANGHDNFSDKMINIIS